MTNDSRSHSQVDPALERALTECIEAIESGQITSVDEWVEKYPEFAGPLRELIANHGRLNEIVARLPAGPSDLNERTILSADAELDSAQEKANQIRYFGDYELIEEIARGGMGVVFRGKQVSLNRPVAVKMILSGELASPDDVARFRLEAEAAANLDHPGIVPIYEIGESQGQHYFSMKYIAGQSLATRLKQRTAEGDQAPLNKEEIRQEVRLLAAVARAVHYAHQRGIIHRDLKPANILIDAEGHPHVTDFGLAKRMTGDSQLTRTGAIVGTPSYMSPEQAGGDSAAVTTATDIYGLGAILYSVLTGHPPFEGAHPLETLQRVQDEAPRKPSSLSPQVDRDLDSVCGKCLAKNPEDRYRSAGEFADDLERWLSGEPVTAAPPSAATVLWRWLSANFRVAAAVLILGVVTGWLVIEPARMTQAHNVGSYLGIYRGSFPTLHPPVILSWLAEYSPWLGAASFLLGLGCFLSMGWWSDWLVRPKSTATALLTGLALGGTAAVAAFFGGVGWTALSQQAVWPIHADLELLAGTIDNDTSFSEGRRLAETYPGVRARQVMKKALADLETGIPVALGYGLLFSLNLLLLPAVLQTLAAFWMRQRGDGLWQRLFYLVELSIPLAVILGGSGYLVYQRPRIVLEVMVFAVIAWLVIESTRRWTLSARRGVLTVVILAGLFALGLAVGPDKLLFGVPIGGGSGGNNAALYIVGAIAATTFVIQKWPWWRYGVYAIWIATFVSTFTGPNWTFATTPSEIESSVRNSAVGMVLVLLLTGIGSWYCSTLAWKQWSASRAAAASTPGARSRRRRWLIRGGIAAGCAILIAIAVLIPLIIRHDRHTKLADAIDRNQPDSIPEIKRLVTEGADITTRGFDNTVAMVAAYWNDPGLLKRSLDAGLDPNAQDSFGNTALHFAAFAPSVEPTRLLLATGAKVNVQNKRGETPLMGAVRNAQFDQIKLLLAAGAEVDVASKSGETAVSIARSLKSGGPRPMRPDLTADDFVRLLQNTSHPSQR